MPQDDDREALFAHLAALVSESQETGDSSKFKDLMLQNPLSFPPSEPTNGANASATQKNVEFGWTENDGVWVLDTTSQTVAENFDMIAKAQPELSHNQIMEAAGATFYRHWSESDDARLVKEKMEKRH